MRTRKMTLRTIDVVGVELDGTRITGGYKETGENGEDDRHG